MGYKWPEEIVLQRFERFHIPEPNSGCWLWIGTLEKTTGYGRFMYGTAHVWSYTKFVGPIKPGLEIDHLCRMRSCVNPKHLEAVTPRVNVLRGEGVAAINARKTHCPAGHTLTGSNLRVDADRRRHCKLCSAAATAAHRSRKKAGEVRVDDQRTERSFGHALTGENLRVGADGAKYCRACAAAYTAASRARKRAAR